jgi:hypothetical protein
MEEGKIHPENLKNNFMQPKNLRGDDVDVRIGIKRFCGGLHNSSGGLHAQKKF